MKRKNIHKIKMEEIYKGQAKYILKIYDKLTPIQKVNAMNMLNNLL